MNQIDTCKSCRFWLADPKGPTDNTPDEDGPVIEDFLAFGGCRRFPPVVSDHMASIAIGPVGFGGHHHDPDDLATCIAVHNSCLWPVTWHATWCGEYERKELR